MMFRFSSIARTFALLAILVAPAILRGQTISWSDTVVYACDSYRWAATGNTYTTGRGLNIATDTACTDSTCQRLFLVLGHTTRITVYDTIVENQLPYTYRGQVFYDYTRNSVINIHPTDPHACDSVITYNLFVHWNIYTRIDSTICENMLPLQWLHRTFNTSGTKRDTVPDIHGADSILTMTLRVRHNTHSTYFDTVVERQLPHSFHSHTAYSDEHDTSVIISNAAGCDSIISYNLFVYRNIERTVDSAVCETALPFLWYGHQLTLQGYYIDTLIAAAPHGEDSIIRLNLTVGHHHSSIIRDTIVENQLPRHFLDTIFTGPTVNNEFTIRDGSICDSLIVYSLFVWYNVYDTADTNICTTNLPFTWNGHRFVGTSSASGTLRGQHGEDSILWMNVYVHTMQRSSVYDTIVENQLPWTYNGQVINNAGISLINIPGTGGCDSIIIYYLHVIENVHTATDTSICESQLPFQWNGMLFLQAGTRSFAYPAANGADSIVDYTLIVHNNDNIYQTATACDTFTWEINGHTYTASTQNAQVSYINRWGCDSTIHLHLTLGHTTYRTDVVEACDSYRWIDRREYHETVYGPTVTDVNASGCDSIITLDLTIYHSVEITIEVTATDVYFWNGETYRQSGYYTAHFTTIHGCDSNVTIDLTIEHSGIDDPDSRQISIYPNPTHGIVNVSGADAMHIDILDITGRTVASYDNTNRANLSHLPAGIYTILVKTNDKTIHRHLIITKAQ